MRVIRYEQEAPGDMVHVDIKKVGRIPLGGGWAVHERGTEAAKASSESSGKSRRGWFEQLDSQQRQPWIAGWV